MRVTKRDLPFATRGGLKFTIPKGSTLEATHDAAGTWWVKPENFPKNSIQRHDAEYYGVAVRADETEERL